MAEKLVINNYTDILCVWAWIAQRRTEELESVWGEKIDLQHQYVNVFGDAHTRIEGQWAGRGGFAGFGTHVVDSAALSEEIRRAFFVDARDVGQLPVLYEIAIGASIDSETIRSRVRDGSATAALMKDYQQAASQGISGSPSWVMNDGRQKLYGNIGYHVLNANVEGLLSQHGDEASWC